MSSKYQLTLALKALREIQSETGQHPGAEQPLFPTLADVLEGLEATPPDALLFGVASDGLPLLLNLRDPRSGPLLVLADRGSGKTTFLQFLAHATSRLLPSEKVRYTVLTNFPDEWRDFESVPHCMGVIPAQDDSPAELLYKLACQAEAAQTTPKSLFTMLLFDGLDSALQLDPSSQENLRYLLEYGPQAGIWPVASVNAVRAVTPAPNTGAGELPEWLPLFRTRIFGRIARPGLAAELTPLPGAGLDTLFPGAQFCLRQKSHWLRFWLPSL